MASTDTGDSFDYVIVGAGSAGATLAARLSEDPSRRVLLLEAGGEAEGDEVHIPAAFPKMFKSQWDWNYSTTEQKQLDGRRAYWPRMRALGGCSSMNAMIYVRGNRHDFDSWRDQYGADGWGYEDCLPYFRRSESNARFGGPWHGQDGPLHVEDRVFTHELSEAFVDSGVSAGLKRNDDFNGAEQEGVGLYQVTCRNGSRWSVNEAFLKPARHRRNLRVGTKAFVTGIEISGGDTPRASGVRFRQQGQEFVVHASRSVVLAGGAINSPQLLMLSGIGPGAHLREHGIDVVADLPGVGTNLQDHPAVPLLWHTKNTTDLAEQETIGNLLKWKTRGNGPLASNIGEAGAFFHTRDGLSAPDQQIHMAPTGFYDNGLHEPTSRLVTLATTLVSVASRGSVRLRSADPAWHPAIDAAYYDDAADLEAMLAGMRRSWEIATQGALGAYLDRPWNLPDSPSEEDLLERIRTWTQTLYHPTSTCAMGDGEDAVVDSALRVRGIDGLRVVDASVMPAVPHGNTNAPTIMVAERAADLMKDEN